MRKRRGLFFITIFISLINLQEVCAGEEIKIAAIFAVTGRASGSNFYDLRGAELAAKEINRGGGLLGNPLQLILLDNQSTAIGSDRAAREAHKSGVVAILGASWSDHSLAIAPVAQKAGIPMVSNYSTNPHLTKVGDFIFRVCYVDTFQAKVMARFAYGNLGIRRIVSLYESGNEYSSGLSRDFSIAFRKTGGTMLDALPYLKDSLDYSEILSQVKKLSPQAIYIPGYEKEVGLIIKQAKKMGIDVPFLGGDGWGDTLPRYLGGVMKEGYEVKPWSPELKDRLSRNFIASYEKEYGEVVGLSGGGAALAYDAVMLIADAIRRAKSVDPKEIRLALANTKSFRGVTGTLRFDGKQDPERGVVINRYFRSAKPAFFMKVGP